MKDHYDALSWNQLVAELRQRDATIARLEATVTELTSKQGDETAASDQASIDGKVTLF
jgi:hypothetical protein